MENTDSQRRVILKWLKEGNSITPMEALNMCGCFRLAARIFELRSKGFNISTEIIEVNKKRFAQYSLVK